jgi:hypothetical protein
MTPKSETLRVIRMRGIVSTAPTAGQTPAIEALRAFVKTVIDRSKRSRCPIGGRARPPVRVREELAIYQRAVLLVEGPAQR